MTIKQLQEILKNLDLPISGKRKADLIDRIRNASEIKAARAAKEAAKKAKAEAKAKRDAARKARQEADDRRNAKYANYTNAPPPRPSPVVYTSPVDKACAVLGLTRSRIQNGDVNRAFKTLSLKHHPDRGGDTEMQQNITMARDTLLQFGYK